MELFLKIYSNINMDDIFAFIGIMTTLATFIVRLTPSKKDDEYVSKASELFYKLMSILPTFGKNPNTKKLEEAYRDLKAKEKTEDGTKPTS